MLDFYQTILNIRKLNDLDITNILDEEIKKLDKSLEEYTTNYEGLCKLYCSNLYECLKNHNLNVKEINLSNLYKELKEHVFLILSYQNQDNHYRYILIDPTYSQFVKKPGQISPLYFEAWPSEILENTNPLLLKNILKKKYCYITDDILKDYLGSFINKKINISLEDIILENYEDSKHR